MITYVVAALLYAFDHIGIVIADEAVKQYCRRQLQLLQRTENAPDSDPQTIIAPSIVALGLRAVIPGPQIHDSWALPQWGRVRFNTANRGGSSCRLRYH